MKLQGEFKVKLRNLEKSLLDALNESTGSILDNDNLISTLERLKKEAAEVAVKMQETETVMEEIGAVSAQYTPLAVACSSIYFTLEQAASIHFLYQFSLRFFLSIFNATLHDNPRLQSVKDAAERIAILTQDLFKLAFHRVSRSLLHEDHLPLALRLLQIRLKDAPETERLDNAEIEYLLKGGEALITSSGSGLETVPFLLPSHANYLVDLQKTLPAFAGIVEHVVEHPEEWQLFFSHPIGDVHVPSSWLNASNPHSKYINVLHCFFDKRLTELLFL